jgi:hypothetical protein
LPERYRSHGAWGESPRRPLSPRLARRSGRAQNRRSRCPLLRHALEDRTRSRPVHELFVACRARGHVQSAQASAQTIQGDGDVNILMGIHTDSDHFGTCSRDRSRHVLLPSVGRGRFALTRAEARRTPLTAMGLLYRKAQASIKSRPSRSGGGDAPGPADESPARHSCRPVKIWVRPAGGQSPPIFSQ